ncbi:BRO-N domain-containing protein [Psychrobacter sp. ASPA161_6]|uniref:BRO-N domain-containing protein n=1 Tax=Psychrobacter sp. ASPA161_6 TaxID=3160962 RepID=UPI003F819C8A
MNTLTFNEVNFNPVQRNGQIWLTSGEVAKALGYKSTKSVNNLYNSNFDEFTTRMTTVIDSMTVRKTGNVMMKTRIFSLRGCHLLAMFARTDIAKKFRKWVLDILDREVITRTDAKQRESLVAACDKLAIGNTLRSDVYTMVANHFGYEKVTQIPTPLLPEAVAFVYEMMLIRQKPSNTMNYVALETNSHALSVHMVYCKEWFNSVRAALEALNPEVTRYISGHFDEGWSAAKLINRSLCNK